MNSLTIIFLISVFEDFPSVYSMLLFVIKFIKVMSVLLHALYGPSVECFSSSWNTLNFDSVGLNLDLGKVGVYILLDCSMLIYCYEVIATISGLNDSIEGTISSQ
jgi:hypothetical protein